jgi:enoyl-CoA hydratase/carnithine racemase
MTSAAGSSNPASQFVTVVIGDGLAWVELKQPPTNTLSNALLEELLTAAAQLAGMREVRAVVISGHGEKAFASGANLREFQEMLSSVPAINHHTDLTRRTFAAVEGLPQPVIALLQASAVGGGLELALCCDLIIADPRARLGLPEVTLGLIPGAGGTQRLARRIGLGRAMRLTLTGELIEAGEAERLGLVDFVSSEGEAREQAQALGGRLAALPMLAVQAAKRAIRVEANLDLGAGLDFEHEQFLTVLASGDAREGVDAFLGRRRPAFAHA